MPPPFIGLAIFLLSFISAFQFSTARSKASNLVSILVYSGDIITANQTHIINVSIPIVFRICYAVFAVGTTFSLRFCFVQRYHIPLFSYANLNCPPASSPRRSARQFGSRFATHNSFRFARTSAVGIGGHTAFPQRRTCSALG